MEARVDRRLLLAALGLLLVACPARGRDDDDSDDDDATGDDDDLPPYDPGCLPHGDNPTHPPQQARVSRLYDGDTGDFVLIDDNAHADVRFLSIDTPEIRHGSEPAECWGPQAQTAAEELLPEGTMVWLTHGPEYQDGFGRVLAYIFVGERPSCTDYDDWVNYQLVLSGNACEFNYDNNPSQQARFSDAESQARDAELGLWGRCDDAQWLCGW